MTGEQELIAFEQYIKDWGNEYKGLSRGGLWQVYRSMDLDCRLEFYKKAIHDVGETK